MNRRDFTRLSALALAAARLPGALAQGPPAPQSSPVLPKPVGFAAVGLGAASTGFMEACAGSPVVRIAALVTGHPDTKGVQFAEKYGIPKSSIYTYETFSKIRDNPDVAALYLGLPNSMHCEYTLRGAEYGKHILCELPMAISSAECLLMIDACRKQQRRLMMAYRLPWDPTWQQAFAILSAGNIGKLQSFRGCLLDSQPAGAWRLSRALGGGGSLLSAGIHPLYGVRFLVHEEPSDFTAVVATGDPSDPRFAEVEQSVEWTMKFPSGAIASCGSSYGQFGPAFLSAHGDKGYIRLDNAFGDSGIHLTGRAGELAFDQTGPGQGHIIQLRQIAEHFANCIRHDWQPLTPGEEGLKDVLAIERIYQAAGTPIA
jgi:predicted dehydrogenase